MKGVQIFNYRDNNITFRTEHGHTYVNATEMTKPFGKFPKDWLILKSTSRFLNELSTVRRIPLTRLTVVLQGGINQGTWLHEDVAIEFARWLSPGFAIWCNDRIKEMMTHGFTATEAKLEEMVNNPDLVIGLATKLKEERARREQIQAEKDRQEAELRITKPKAEYYDNVLQATNAVPISIVADDVGMSAISLNKVLRRLGIQYKVGGKWCLRQKYKGNGYTENITHHYTRSNGETGSSVHMYWTQVGRKFIHDILRQEGITSRATQKKQSPVSPESSG